MRGKSPEPWKGPSASEAGRLESVAEAPDPIYVGPAAGKDAVRPNRAQALVVRRQHELGVVELREIAPEQRRSELGVVERVGKVDPPMEQRWTCPGRGVGLDLHQADGAGLR